jgi:hypothetical protein
MKILIYAPYGRFSNESGLVYLFSRFVREKASVVALIDNGVFSVSDRDEEVSWRRKVCTCAEWTWEQVQMAQWAGVETRELSTIITPNFLNESQEGLVEEAKGTFSRRYGTFDPHHRGHQQFAKRLNSSVLRLKAGLDRYLSISKPDLVICTGGQDFQSRTALGVCSSLRIPSSLFSFSFEHRGIRVFNSSKNEFLSCALVVPDVREFRADIDTWSPEVKEILSEIARFLGVTL